ncbi:hypothetical protein EV650_6204 [Kribbella kalugense]|uniref:Uncharacterized protein n=1 Tax=Kribbella kalugense TaxID=2512221 RepID=A0A4V6Q8E5_9ACTN|nr:hypothetical protein EV650_6204 [Kribbella kalugense]
MSADLQAIATERRSAGHAGRAAGAAIVMALVSGVEWLR